MEEPPKPSEEKPSKVVIREEPMDEEEPPKPMEEDPRKPETPSKTDSEEARAVRTLSHHSLCISHVEILLTMHF